MRFVVLRILGVVAIGLVAGWQLLAAESVSASPVSALRIHVLMLAGQAARVTVANPNPAPMVLRRIEVVGSSNSRCSVQTRLPGLPRVVPAGGTVTMRAGGFLDRPATCGRVRIAVWAVAQPLQTSG